MRWLLLLLCSCNDVFDLEDTTSIAVVPDRDGDGVADKDDNCIEVINPMQADGDGDGFGDACDGCPLLPTMLNHDEDGDGRGDECDQCPGQPEFEGDADKDGIGDTCDDVLVPGANQRVLFDTFRRLDPMWTMGPTEWRITKDAIAPLASLPADDTGLRASDELVFDEKPWSIHLGVHAKSAWQTGDFGILLLDDADAVVARCMVKCTSATSCSLVLQYMQLAPLELPVQPEPMFHLTFSGVTQAGGVDTRCTSIKPGGLISGVQGSSAGRFAIIASPNVDITYVEVLR